MIALARTVALWTAVIGLAGLVALVLMGAGLGFLGPVNDVLGGVTGLLALTLAVVGRDLLPASPAVRTGALLAAVVGGVLVAAGSVLVLTGRTGWYLAGLWSALGWAFLGIWFLVLVLALREDTGWPAWASVVGLVGAILMIVGFGVVPGIARAVDDWGQAGWQLVVPQAANALGSLLFLVWCLAAGRGGPG
ncbi:MAG TPA: hypothetical protein VFL59_08685 [Candidatus Nanopelagicales bacterium]|nr:hypothetical protein [Candidatus Nanopelagicales bacterium]